MAEFSIYTNRTIPPGVNLGLDTVVAGINDESAALLHVEKSSLTASFEAAMSAVIAERISPTEAEALAHVRFSPLLDPMLIEQLELPSDTPQLWEIGTGYADQRIRGNGYYTDMRNGLLEMYAEQIISGNILILGTTKAAPVVRVLKASEQVGLPAHITHHSTFPRISALTCVCTGDFGHGYQYGMDACDKRLSSDIIPVGEIWDAKDKVRISTIPVSERNGSSIIPCTKYLHGPLETAHRLNDILTKRFPQPQMMVDQLQKLNYYKPTV